MPNQVCHNLLPVDKSKLTQSSRNKPSSSSSAIKVKADFPAVEKELKPSGVGAVQLGEASSKLDEFREIKKVADLLNIGPWYWGQFPRSIEKGTRRMERNLIMPSFSFDSPHRASSK